MPGRAQQAPRGRFAFADTTLLRDTLGLHFDGLFPLADSLGITPDTLRALSIRYRYTFTRLLKLADSLQMIVDSVGPVMFRERFNPPATGVRRARSFDYNTTYNINRNSTDWTNTTSYLVPAGPLVVTGSSSILINRNLVGGQTRIDQTRTLTSRADWRLSRDFSAATEAVLSRTDNRARGSSNFTGSSNNLSLSVRNQRRLGAGLSSDFNLSGGALSSSSSGEEKRGLTGQLRERLRYSTGSWLTHEVGGSLSGGLARARISGDRDYTRAKDLSQNLNGTLGLFSSAPVGANVSYNLSDTRVENPGTGGTVKQVNSGRNGLDMTLRARLDNDRGITVSERLSSSREASATDATVQNSGRDQALSVSGRAVMISRAR